MSIDGIGRNGVVSIETLRQARQQRTADAPAGAASDADTDAGVQKTSESAAPARATQMRTERPRTNEEQKQLLAEFKKETAGLADVRRDKVIEAKLRISTGYYNRPDVRRQVLRSLLANLLPRESEPRQETPES